jgi:glycosyltransferase involved in cell wall biosynthesis
MGEVMNPKVSVIVPVYNVEKYLAKCLDSLINQTLKEIEIIVVNDGSSDGSQAIIEYYAKNHPEKILAFNKTNGGLSDARNFGLQHAKGDFIGFIDSDDYAELDLYQNMYELAQKNGSDLVLCDLEYVYEDGRSPILMKGYESKLGRPIQQSVFLAPLFAWNKLYKRDFFLNSGLTFPKGLWYEDIPVTVPLFAMAQNIQYLNQVGVHYLQRSSSIMGSTDHPKMHDIFNIIESLYTWFEEKDLLTLYNEELEYLFIEHLLLYGSFRFLRSNDAALMRNAFSLIQKYFKNYRKNPYLKSLKPSYQIYLQLLSPKTVFVLKALLRKKVKHG